jgi:cystathionine beta-lyase/cystathionine gamma-synthase
MGLGERKRDGLGNGGTADRSRWALETTLVHAGRTPAAPVSTAMPIYPSTTFQAPSPEALDRILGGEIAGYSYTRHANPTVDALAEAVAALEGGDAAVCYGSGMAAIDAALYAAGVKAGDRVLLSRDLYGASLNLAQSVWGEAGVEAVTEDFGDLDRFEAALRRYAPRAVLFEVLSNPLLRIVDGPAVVALAARYGAVSIVDNTFTTPLSCRPLEWGADLVVHSATKYLGGHGDATGGVVVARAAFRPRLLQYLKLRGAVLGPFEAWLVHRGLRTLALRYVRQCDNARVLAERLWASGRFAQVIHPLLPNHPSRALAERILGGRGGAVVTLELRGGRPAVFDFLRRLKLVGSATSVGDVYTLCLYPVMASHRNLSVAERARMGITDGIVRVAVGIEHVDDIFRDVLQAAETD